MELFKILGYIGIVMLLANTIFYFKSFAVNGRAFKFFTIYLAIISVIQVLTYYTAIILKEENIYLSNFYIIVQFIALSFFYMWIFNNKVVGYIMLLVSVFLAYQYGSDLTLFSRYNPLGITITQGLLIIYSILYFYKSLTLKKNPFVLINIGIFLYLICSTLIFSSGSLFGLNIISKEGYILLLQLNGAFYIVYQVLIFVERYKNYRSHNRVKK